MENSEMVEKARQRFACNAGLHTMYFRETCEQIAQFAAAQVEPYRNLLVEIVEAYKADNIKRANEAVAKAKEFLGNASR